MSRGRGALVLSLFLVVGCGGGGDDDDDDIVGGPDAAAGDPDAAGDGWLTLVSGDWTRAAGTEGYTCVYKTIEEDIWVTAFDPIAPTGTHHTVVSIGPKVREDGVVPCGANTNQQVFIAGSGVGTGAYELPEGVALKMEAGQQMLLNLHLFNFSESELTGASGMRVKTIPEAEVVHEAETVIFGVYQFELPPGETTTYTGSCTMGADTNVVSVFPHMHMLGAHMKITAESSVMGDVVVHDKPYNFDDQYIYGIDTVPMNAGDKLVVDCTWNNTTENTVTFGDSSLEEMCFVVSYRYPPVGSTFCIN